MAYAAVSSVLTTLDELQDPIQSENIHYPRAGVKHLHKKLTFLREFLDLDSSGGDLVNRLREAMYDAEDILDSNISNFVLSRDSASWSEEKYMSSFSQDLQRVITEVDSIAEAAETISSLTKRPVLMLTWSSPSIQQLSRRNLIVGCDDVLRDLNARLTSSSRALESVAVFGVPGIGKTHLARFVYDDPDIRAVFQMSGWAKVSQEYSKKEVLLLLMRSMGSLGSGKGRDFTEDELARRFSRSFKSKRCLIVLDDVCSLEAWADLEELFPDYSNGSRVVLTTRQKEVAKSVGRVEEIPPLRDEEPWSLLQKVAFRYKSCPKEVEETARRVAAACRGLPLAIVTVGGVLAEAAAEDWEIAASSLSRCGRSNQELIEAVMFLSYKSLRQNARACLLYMGMFPNNYEIPVSKLVKLWIAEGFIEKDGQNQSLEEVAEDCLKQLVSRGIILVSEHSPIGKMRSCRFDGVYHEFVKKKAEEEKFFRVVDRYTGRFPHENWDQGRFCILANVRFARGDESKKMKVRSLLFGGVQEQHPLWVNLDFKLLRVLDALKIRFCSFPEEILKLVHLRYLALTYEGEVPESICELWNLQFLIVLRCLSSKTSDSVARLPLEIWNLKELRHLQLMGTDLPDPSSLTTSLENLVTLLDVSSHSCTLGILQRVPNLTKLGVRIESPGLGAALDLGFLANIGTLQHLRSLKCVVVHPDFMSQRLSSVPSSLPPTLTKISLSGCGLSWDVDMKAIATLPKLESLKLRWCAFRGSRWKQGQVQGQIEFPSLKFLLLQDLNIKFWESSSSNHFPQLMNLVIRHCYQLKEIPSAIGNIPTLKRIELVDCSSSAMRSAQRLKEEQRSKGYIQVDSHSSRDD